MATSITGEGSPLDDYFRDNDDSSDSSPSWKDAVSSGNQSPISEGSGEITLVNSHSPLSKDKGWTGPQDCFAGPSKSAAPITPPHVGRRISSMDISPPGAFASPRQLRRREAEKFAERFKYLICSSGLLEKDWVPGLGGDEEIRDSLDGASARDTEDAKGRDAGQDVGALEVPWLEVVHVKLSGRPDLQGAMVILLGGVGWMVGSFIGVAVLCAAGLGILMISSCVRARRKPPTRIETPIKTQSLPNSRHAALLAALGTLLASSRSLDTSLDEALHLLSPSAPISHQRPLRTSLHRLCNNMTDHLASATSTLLEMVDRTELGALAEMYDIPMAQGLHGRRISDSSDEEASEEQPGLATKATTGRVPSPRKPSPPFQTVPEAPPTQLRALSMATTHSLPGRFRPTHSKHLSLTPSRSYRPLMLPRSAVDDRFTQLPNRTPRLSAHASWDQEAFEAARNEGIRADWVGGKRDRSRPRHERRITENDEEETLDGDISGSSDEPRTTLVTPILPALNSPVMPEGPKRMVMSPSMDTFLPQRRSPLSRDSPPAKLPNQAHDIFAPIAPSASDPVGIVPTSRLQDFNIASTLGVARKPAASENPKRRSLQSMTYYPSSTTTEDLSLTRTHSLPPSDLQALRVASASSSRRPSLASSVSAKSPGLSASTSLPTRLSPARPTESAEATVRRVRVASLSPLTLPALKAACLGLHLKRRKMACCLLGLDFVGEEDEDYWRDVIDMLEELSNAMDNERLALQVALADASKTRHRWVSTSSASDESSVLSALPAPPWAMASSLARDHADFAPRDSKSAKLYQRIMALQTGLGETWERVARAARTLERAEDPGESSRDFQDRWTDIRESLGVLVRDWERGREVVSRLVPNYADDQPEESQREDFVSLSQAPRSSLDLPDFMQAWTAGEMEDDALAGPEQPLDQAMTENLPAPGIDQVFEGVPDTRTDQLHNLPREERIRLTREARAKGLTVREMLSQTSAPPMEDGVKAQKEAGGMVVKELEGMIGIIRRRKGHLDEGTSTPTGPSAPKAEELPRTVRRVSREREPSRSGATSASPSVDVATDGGLERDERFLEDLQKAFVFPKRNVGDDLS